MYANIISASMGDYSVHETFIESIRHVEYRTILLTPSRLCMLSGQDGLQELTC